MHHPTDRIAHTTAFVAPVVEHWLERELAQWVHHGGSIRRPIVPFYFICSDRIAHTTAFVTQVVEHWLELEKPRLF